jgi:hypothetical protein
MTLGRLIKELQAIQRKHGSRVPVCANTQVLRESCNDVWQVVDLSTTKVDSVGQVDGDGFQKNRKDGTEVERKCVVLS